MKLADTLDLGSNTERCAGSSPVIRTIFRHHNGDIARLTLVKSIPIYRGVFLFMTFPHRRNLLLINKKAPAISYVAGAVIYKFSREISYIIVCLVLR